MKLNEGDLTAATGLAVLAIGIGMIYVPAALIVVGLVVLAFGALLSLESR